ncbi:telomere binding protein [Vanrija albida]|uniref:Telomere binding protein n=1 Tax=Vanrija albida TaxID=181172 RepID=A0ABR3Q1N9_9TREE
MTPPLSASFTKLIDHIAIAIPTTMAEGDDPAAALRSLRDALRAPPATAEDFTFALSTALDALGLSPTSIAAAPGAPRAIARALPTAQQALLACLPTFLPALDARARTLVDSLFVPLKRGDTIAAGRAVALTSYLNLGAMLAPSPPSPLPAESRPFLLETLGHLATGYGLDDTYWACYAASAQPLMWADALRALASLPARAANAVGRWREAGWAGEVPPQLVPRAYFDNVARRLEGLSYELAQAGAEPAPLREAYAKLAGLGLLAAPSAEAGPAPALFPAFLPPALAHLHPEEGTLPPYPVGFFPALLLPLPASTLAALTDSLAQHLAFRLASASSPLEPDVPDERVRRAAVVLAGFLGPAAVGADSWAPLLQTLLRAGGEDIPKVALRRSIVAWATGGGVSAAKQLIDRIMDVWSDPKQIKFGVYGQIFGLTHSLILALSLLPQYDPYLVGLASRAQFMQAVQSFLSHPSTKIRRLGMLVAEILSELTIVDSGEDGPTEEETMAELQADLEDDSMGEEPRKRNRKPVKARRLRFTGMWDGSGDGKDECRWLRRSLGVKDTDAVLSDDPSGTAWLLGWDKDVEPEPEVAKPSAVELPSPKLEPTRGRKHQSRPKIVMLDDDQANDPLEGYAESDPGSSRSASPTPSFLEEVAADPTLAIDATKKKKLKRPVYVRQLVELLRDKDKPESIEMGLEWGEGLVRAKRNFGGEVVENAVDVAQAAISLSDPYHLDDFDKKRQGLVTALVACSPRNVPPFLAEQYFSASYSLLQKSVMLTAMAMGARELAGLPVPDPPRTTRRVDFPSKTLPPALHKQYIMPQDQPEQQQQGQLEDAADDMRKLLLSKGARQGEETVPELARQRRLRVGEPARQKVAVEGSLAAKQMAAKPAQQPPVAPFSSVAAEFFVLPLINRFWEYFQDASVRETSAIASGGRYRGAGTGLVLSPMALEKFLLTLALLIHAARHAPTFLAVLAPAALELATTVGARHQAAPDLDGQADTSPQAQVVSAALGLALAALDTAVDLDKGRTFALDAPALVLGAGEWAHGVFEAESGGAKASGGGREGRLRAAAAGVVVKVAEIGEAFGGLGGGLGR